MPDARKLASGKTPLVIAARGKLLSWRINCEGNDYQTKFQGSLKDIRIWSVPRSSMFFRESPYMELTGFYSVSNPNVAR
jgi:hypothetical protein